MTAATPEPAADVHEANMPEPMLPFEAEDTNTEPDTAQHGWPQVDTEPPAYRSLDWWKAQARTHESQAQAVTAERDQLAGRVEAMQRQLVESMLAGKLHNPGDVWRYGPPLADLLTDDGGVDATKVETARQAIVSAYPYVAPNAAAPSSVVGFGAQKPDLDAADTPTFADLLKAAAHGSRGVATE